MTWNLVALASDDAGGPLCHECRGVPDTSTIRQQSTAKRNANIFDTVRMPILVGGG